MLKLIYAPDPILKKESVSIPQVDDHHRELIKQMYEIMYSANGVGLAAPQIGLNIRIFVLDAGSRDEEKIATEETSSQHTLGKRCNAKISGNEATSQRTGIVR